MHIEKYSKGDVITTEGDLSDSAFYLQSGSVEILGKTSEGECVLGEHTTGDFFGEMGLILEAPRMATVRALSDVVVEVYDLESFELEVINDTEKRAAYLPNLFERMRLICGLLGESRSAQTNQVVGETNLAGSEIPFLPEGESFAEVTQKEKDPDGEIQSIHLKTLRPLQEGKQCVDLQIKKFPFYIGRTSRSKILVENDFYIDDPKPHKVSRGHCSIEQRAGRFIVRDRFSSLGTTVNGQRIGKNARSFVAQLKLGENELTLGNDAGRYSLVLIIE